MPFAQRAWPTVTESNDSAAGGPLCAQGLPTPEARLTGASKRKRGTQTGTVLAGLCLFKHFSHHHPPSGLSLIDETGIPARFRAITGACHILCPVPVAPLPTDCIGRVDGDVPLYYSTIKGPEGGLD